MFFLQKCQHPPCLTQAVCFESKLFVGQCQQWIRCVIVYNISIACLYLREATVHAVSNVDGISQQAWQIEMEPQTVWPLWFGGHVKWLDCHPWHFPCRKKQGISTKPMVGEVRVLGWTIHTQKHVHGHDNSLLVLHSTICLTRMGALWNDAKNRFTLGLCCCLAC